MSTKHRRPEQLSLLRPSELPIQFRIDQRTRERGLAHVAEIRRQLAAMRAVHSGDTLASIAEAPRRAA
ncbi:MAG: hypothetical protein QM733_24350 [Ilumatobacteraceae bacterium]